MAAVGNLSTPALSIDLPGVTPGNPSPDGAIEGRLAGNGDGLGSRETRVEPLEVFQHAARHGRDGPVGFGQVDRLDRLIDQLPNLRVFLQQAGLAGAA